MLPLCALWSCLLAKQLLAPSGLQAAGGPGRFLAERDGNHPSRRLDDVLISSSAQGYKTPRDHLLQHPHLVSKKIGPRGGQALIQGHPTT